MTLAELAPKDTSNSKQGSKPRGKRTLHRRQGPPGTRNTLLDSTPMSSIAALRLVTARAAPAGRRAMGGGTATRPRPSTEGRAPAFNMCAGLLIFEALRWVDPLASRMGSDVGPSTLRGAVDATASQQRTNACAPRSSTASRSTRAAWPRPSSRPSPAVPASSASPRSSRTRSTASSSKQRGAISLLVY